MGGKPRRTLRFAFWACVLCCCVANANADVLDDMPPPEIVDERVRGPNDLDTAVWQIAALDYLSQTATLLAVRVRGTNDPAVGARIQSYWTHRWNVQQRAIGATNPKIGQPARIAAAKRLGRREAALNANPELRAKLVERFRQELLPASVREYLDALIARERRKLELEARIQATRSPAVGDVAALAALELRDWAEELPAPYKRTAVTVVSIPVSVWVLILIAWTVLGIARGIGFGASPDDPLLVRNGTRRRRLRFNLGQVISIDRWTEAKTHRSYTSVVDGNGVHQQIPHDSVTTSQHLRVFLRLANGQESEISLLDEDLPVRPGHHLVECWATKPKEWGGPYQFFHVCELGRTQFMPGNNHHLTKARPRIFLPVVILGTCAALLIWDLKGVFALIGVPIVYVIVMGIVNRRRMKVFRTQFVPRVLASARAEPASDRIDVGDAAISRA